MKWGELHVDDVVLGADGHEYRVAIRWQMGGREWFELRPMENDLGSVTCSPPLTAEVTLVQRADHSAEASAVNAFISAGIEIDILRESRKNA